MKIRLNAAWLKEKRLQISMIIIIGLIFCQNILIILLDIKRETILEELNAINRNNQFLKEKYADHLAWNVDLLESIVVGVNFKGQLNHNETDFAKWYYSFSGTRPYWDMDNERRSIFDKMGPVNLNLHNSARMMYGEDLGEKIKIYNTETKKDLKEMSSLLSSYIDLNNTLLIQKYNSYNIYSKTSKISSIAVSVLIIGLIIFLIFTIIHSTLANMKQYKNALKNISGGNISTRLEIITKDEYGTLTVYFNDFLERIQEIIETVKLNSNQLAESSTGMNEVINSFNSNFQEQASFAEEINAVSDRIVEGMDRIMISSQKQSESLSSLLNIINTMSHLIFKMTGQLKDSANETFLILKEAQYGEKLLSDMNKNMVSINESSHKITDIIEIINDISEKINLLSLNAAIEAARAGDSGGGFAVVAKEITKLAYNTSSSIKGIDSLIKNNVRETEKGIKSVNETTKRLKKVISGMNNIGAMMNSILESMREQSETNETVNKEAELVVSSDREIKVSIETQNNGIKEIALAISNINKLVQDNAAGIEEISYNISSLKDMAFKLNSNINFFNTDLANSSLSGTI